MPEGTLNRETVALAARLLRAAVLEPWESVDQVVTAAERLGDILGDPTTPGTGAWHLRHIVEIFRLHARTVMAGVGDAAAAETVSPPELPVPRHGAWSARAARDDLLGELDRFCRWLTAQSDETLAREFEYGRRVDATAMLSVMLQHITWHSAAVHYWMRWRGGAV